MRFIRDAAFKGNCIAFAIIWLYSIKVIILPCHGRELGSFPNRVVLLLFVTWLVSSHGRLDQNKLGDKYKVISSIRYCDSEMSLMENTYNLCHT